LPALRKLSTPSPVCSEYEQTLELSSEESSSPPRSSKILEPSCLHLPKSPEQEKLQHKQPETLQLRIEECRAALLRHQEAVEALEAETGVSSCEAMSARSQVSATPALFQAHALRLKRLCVDGLGVSVFEEAKRRLQALGRAGPVERARARQVMLEVLGLERIGFHSLLDQLAHIEGWGSRERRERDHATPLCKHS